MTTESSPATFTCEFSYPVETVFDHWLDPVTRRAVLLRQVYKNGIKVLDPTLGGQEHYEYRWRNRLTSSETRQYTKVLRPEVIEAEVFVVPSKNFGPKWIPTPPSHTRRESLSFESTDGGCRILARTFFQRRLTKRWSMSSDQGSTATWWKLDLEVFAASLTDRFG